MWNGQHKNFGREFIFPADLCYNKFMKKHIANIITASRIIFSLPLLFIPLSSAWFYIFYLFCGLSDMIDGTMARKTGTASKFGARLDSASDFVLMFVCCLKILPLIHIPVWLWAWIIGIALIKIFNIMLVFIQKKKLISIHSMFNKITGLALFLLPLTLTFVETTCSIVTVCALATIAAIQEMYLTLKEQEIL